MGERERERDRHPLEARAQVPDKREREREREAHKATMSSVAKFLVEKHWKIAQVVIPASVLFGFVYTMKYGTNPLQDSFSDAAVRSTRELPLHSVSMRLNLGQARFSSTTSREEDK